MAHFYPNNGLSVLSRDSRGWQVIEVAADPKNVIFRVKIPVGNNSFKKLELVSQELPLRVYVNPEIDQPDEWEVPAGSGYKLLVLSPGLSSS